MGGPTTHPPCPLRDPGEIPEEVAAVGKEGETPEDPRDKKQYPGSTRPGGLGGEADHSHTTGRIPRIGGTNVRCEHRLVSRLSGTGTGDPFTP